MVFKDSVWCQIMIVKYLFKTNFKIDEKFNGKGIQNNGI